MRLTRASYQPELNLWASILELAIIDYTSKYYSERENASAWIFSDDKNRATSFDSICELFDINPNRLRKTLLADPMVIRNRISGKSKHLIEELKEEDGS